MAPPRKARDEPIPMRSPAKTPEARENQLIAAAMDLAEKQIREGTASSQVVTHFLKLGDTTRQLEIEKLRSETELSQAKVKSLQSVEKLEDLIQEAKAAMTSYQGRDEEIVD